VSVAASNAERPPPLIACRRSFAVGFNPVFTSLVSLVLIVAFVFMMMVVDNRNGARQLGAKLLTVCRGHVTRTT